ncbi:hypothetical protein ACWELO_10055 [Streptomyces sp. NPDC004596]
MHHALPDAHARTSRLLPPDTGPSPSEIRAERRRLIESIRALRRFLDKRRAFELADQRRLNREARDRSRAEAAHGKAIRRIHACRTRQENSLTRKLDGLDGKRDVQEEQALAVLRRQSTERVLSSTYLTSSEVNGIGKGLVRDLAAQGIRTAAEFKRVSWGKAPHGEGGDVLCIHRTRGGNLHINGIGEHRGRPLIAWRDSAVALAGLNDVLHVVSAVDGDVNENAVELRRDIGMLLLAQGRTADAFDVLEPLHADLCLVFGPDDELTAEVAETLAVIRLDLDGGGPDCPS